ADNRRPIWVMLLSSYWQDGNSLGVDAIMTNYPEDVK
uniref:Dermonecrotic toxin LgSicTox-beta-LOXN1/LOXN7 (Fragments) n=1 Tax=Loxosceles gaucho TaxID=58216 RepID=BX17_LOXGA|nr:RecName: Full=Dermonecrotic toxin LgSicTox-beta-LOXN1/LOXN7; AltName: Full=Phospholipase D; Short=PLD; AltName: Full=Sphingomyelin phosphodiesterase D; Short=SMD; Short=SMase D; Short=Sphingomyelinase D [Loxosceles gaucho]